MIVQIITAGPYTAHGNKQIYIPESVLRTTVKDWQSKRKAAGATAPLGQVQQSFEDSSIYSRLNVAEVSHEVRDVIYNQRTKTVEAELFLLDTPRGKALKAMTTADQQKFLWRIPIGVHRYVERSKGIIDLADFQLSRVDLFVATTPFEYPWAHVYKAAAYDRAMSILD